MCIQAFNSQNSILLTFWNFSSMKSYKRCQGMRKKRKSTGDGVASEASCRSFERSTAHDVHLKRVVMA